MDVDGQAEQQRGTKRHARAAGLDDEGSEQAVDSAAGELNTDTQDGDEWSGAFDELDDVDWSGLLPAESEKAGKMILKPISKLHQLPAAENTRAHKQTPQHRVQDEQQLGETEASETVGSTSNHRNDQGAAFTDFWDDVDIHNLNDAAMDAGPIAGPSAFMGGGFRSARGTRLAPPSEAAIARARRALASPEHTSQPPNHSTSEVTPQILETPILPRKKSAQPFDVPSPAFKPLFMNNEGGPLQPLRLGPKNGHTLLPPRLLGDNGHAFNDAFSTGAGGKVIMPSRGRVQANLARLNAAMSEHDDTDIRACITEAGLKGSDKFADDVSVHNHIDTGYAPPKELAVEQRNISVPEPQAQLAVGFVTGKGRTVAAPSKGALEKANALFAQPSQETIQPPHEQQQSSLVQKNLPENGPAGVQLGGFTFGNGKAVHMPSEAAIAQALARISGDDPQDILHPITPARQPLARKNGNAPPSMASANPFAQKTPSAPSVSRSAGVTSLTKPFKPPSRVNGLSPGTAVGNHFSQLDLRMTQRNTPRNAVGKGTFRTPFKNGRKPTQAELESNKSAILASQQVSFGVQELEKIASHRVNKLPSKDSVFDLQTTKPRKGLREYGVYPRYSIDALIEADLPNEVIFMTLAKAEHHRFRGLFGHAMAYEELVTWGRCRGISAAWVQNHWTLIVWKLAGQVRARPSELASWWSFENVCNQLKYRYERECLLSHRSCLKRIQERDSSSTSPMVLLVTQVFFEDREVAPIPGSDEEIQGRVVTERVAVGLELSDGWYRIKANLDDSLYRAVWSGKMFSGMKIYVQGAKLDGGGDGADPFDAYGSSTLVISGNSTARAPWDAKLGFQRKSRVPIICTFRSLLPDGGLVPFIDCIITRIYPVGYKGAYVEGESQDVWNEQEEAERLREYDLERQKCMVDVQEEHQAYLQKLAVLRDQLREAAHRARGCKLDANAASDAINQFDFHDIFQKLEEQPDKASVIIGSLTRTLIDETLEHAERRLSNLQADLGEEIRREVESRCPPRVARQFRIVRVKDTHNPGCGRECQLNVSDPERLGSDFFREGRRYLVSGSGWIKP